MKERGKKLAAVFMNDPSQFDIITYHLGGEADMRGTASMGWDTPLYVVHPFNSQVKFIQQETEKMKNHPGSVARDFPPVGGTAERQFPHRGSGNRRLSDRETLALHLRG